MLILIKTSIDNIIILLKIVRPQPLKIFRTIQTIIT